MPFTLPELVTLSRCLRDACLGIIKLAYPETKAEHREEYMAAFRSVGVKTNTEVQQRIQAEQKRWVQLFKVTMFHLPGKTPLFSPKRPIMKASHSDFEGRLSRIRSSPSCSLVVFRVSFTFKSFLANVANMLRMYQGFSIKDLLKGLLSAKTTH